MEPAFEVFRSVFRATSAALLTVVDGNTNLKTYMQRAGYLAQKKMNPRSEYAFELIDD